MGGFLQESIPMTLILIGITIGYLTLTRSFSYIGVVPAGIYLGEVLLACFAIFKPKSIWTRLFGPLVRAGYPVAMFSWALFFAGAYGALQVLRAVLDQSSLVTPLRLFAFTYYMLFVFIGIWWGLNDRQALNRLIVVLAWWNAAYGVAYLLLLNRFEMVLPWVNSVPLFSQSIGSTIALIGLLSIHPKPRYWRVLLAANSFVLIATQGRALWLGFVAVLLVGAVLLRRVKALFIGATALALVLSALIVTDGRLPGPLDQGGLISSSEIIGRAFAPFNADIARRYTDNYQQYAGTVSWRTLGWRAIWEAVHKKPATAMIGIGYGQSLSHLSSRFIGNETLSPHSWFFFALGYGGWIGVLLFTWCQTTLAVLLWKAYRRTKSPVGLLVWVNGIIVAAFGNFLEAPFGAIPFYLIIGLCISPLYIAPPNESPTSRAGMA